MTLIQGSPFRTAQRPGPSKTTSWASGFEQIFPLYFVISRSKSFKILEVGIMVCNYMYVCFFCFTVFTLHMFIICHSSSVFTLCHRNVPFHTTISVLISTKHSLGLFILCFRNVTHYSTISMSISTKHLPAVAIFKWLSTVVVNFMWSTICCQIKHG